MDKYQVTVWRGAGPTDANKGLSSAMMAGAAAAEVLLAPRPALVVHRLSCYERTETPMRQTRMVQVLLTVLLVALGGAISVLWAADRGDAPGRQAYLRYCGACHGAQAKGDGIVSSFMRPTPPDLTTIARRNGGTFPTEQVEKTVDGREMLHAHGTPTMPVWGAILSQNLGSRGTQRPAIERRVVGQILDVVEYLRTIQEK
jgi:hypothetical protein